MDYTKIGILKTYSFVRAFINGEINDKLFLKDFSAFLQDDDFKNEFGFETEEIDINELLTLINVLKNPQPVKVLKYSVLLYFSNFLSSKLGCHINVLDFSTTRSGTHKYIKALTILNIPLVKQAKRLCVISAGNYAYSLIKAMKDLKMKQQLVIIINKSFDDTSLHKFKSENVKIVKTDLEKGYVPAEIPMLELIYDDKKLREIRSNDERFEYEFKNNVNITDFYVLTRYGWYDMPDSVRKFILYKDLAENLEYYDYVACPVGSGELIYGLWSGFLGKRQPNFLGIVPIDAHPLGSKNIVVDFDKIKNSKASALVTPIYYMEKMTKQPNINFLAANNNEFLEANKLAKKAGINSEISGSAGLVFLDENVRQRAKISISPSTRVLIVNTGNGRILA